MTRDYFYLAFKMSLVKILFRVEMKIRDFFKTVSERCGEANHAFLCQ
jgi:hypothetical protein